MKYSRKKYFINKKYLLLLLFTFAGHAYSQNQISKGKQIIDFETVAHWPKLDGGASRLSPNGKFLIYMILNHPFGRTTTIIQSTENSWKREYVDLKGVDFTQDSRRAILMKGDTLCLLTLGSNEKTYIPKVGHYELFTRNKKSWLAYQKTAEKDVLILRDLNSGKEEQLSGVTDFQFDSHQRSLLWQSKKEEQGQTLYTLHRMNLETGQVKLIGENVKEPAGNWLFNESGSLLFFTTTLIRGVDTLNELHHYTIATNVEQVVWKNRKTPGSFSFDLKGEQVTFFTQDTIWYFNSGKKQVSPLATNHSSGIENGLKLSDHGPLFFSKDGKQVIFYLEEKAKELRKVSADAVKLDVWHYQDKELQSVQLRSGEPSSKEYVAAADVDKNRVIRLAKKGEQVIDERGAQKYVLVHTETSPSQEWYWQKGSEAKYFLVSLVDGSRIPLPIDTRYGDPIVMLSPHADYVIYYDPNEDGYCSYQIAGGVTRHLTKGLGISFRREQYYKYFNSPNPFFCVEPRPRGIAGWGNGDSDLLVYDNNDIWKLDPSGIKMPVNSTNGYGRKHHIQFETNPGLNYQNGLEGKNFLILEAFNEETKEHGYYFLKSFEQQDPKPWTMGPYSRGNLEKAEGADVWLISRSSPTDATNLYIARNNFKTITRLSNFQPQKDYNWYTTELVNWKLPNGEICQGLLFKPENFDPTKKYPLIFNYYQQSSQGAFDYYEPELAASTNINVPYFASRKYLVFMPDIHYKMGYPGQSALNSIESAAKELCLRPYVDEKRMGLAGFSWGGYETNYVVTHSHRFAAVATGAGSVDFISEYNTTNMMGYSLQPNVEVGQLRMGFTPWQKPELYVENSPVLKADQVSTPILMLQNKLDAATNWSQGEEFFTALRRLGKKVWMLQYDGEGHGLSQEKNIKDYNIRLTQFFDHYLKDVPPPRWMTQGIPASMKGIDNGLALDTSGKQP